jgi:hypothetical protein
MGSFPAIPVFDFHAFYTLFETFMSSSVLVWANLVAVAALLSAIQLQTLAFREEKRMLSSFFYHCSIG